MRRPIVNRGVRLLLALAIIAANCTTPGISHAHPDGGKPHTHGEKPAERSRVHSHHSHHGHSHTTHTHRHSQDEGKAIGEGIAHVHYGFFGLPLSVPADKTNGGHEPQSDFSLKPEVAGINCGATSLARLISATVPTSALLHIAMCSPPLELWTTCHPPHKNLSLLCDTARLERSGVRQI